MTKINLLPRELQKASTAPLRLLVTGACGFLVCVIALLAYGYMWFSNDALAGKVERKQVEVEHLKRRALEVDALLEDIAEYKERERAIISIKTNRILWSRKLDELCQLTPNYIWVVRLDMRELDPSEYKWEQGVVQTGGFLRLRCYSSGDEVNRMTDYRQKLKNVDEFYLKFLQENLKPESFYADFVNITPPEWRFVYLKGYRNPNNIRFSVRLDLRPLVERRTGPAA
ncbi:MAG: PilN domain-containing protein [Planctomycetota bacterium]